MQIVKRGPPTFLAIVRWLWRRRSHCTLLAVAWLVHYLHGVRRVRLLRGRGSKPGSLKSVQEANKRLTRIIDQCPSLCSVYWPTWYAPTAILQFTLLGLKEFRARFLENSPYTREVLSLKDGGRIALDWVAPADVRQPGEAGETLPVCVLLHGMAADSSSVTMKDLARSLAARGLPVVVVNRRGYGDIGLGEGEAKLSLFGFDDDLDEALSAVDRRHPRKPLAIIGFSCGSGFAGRYVGSRANLSAWKSKDSTDIEKKPRLLCAVAYDPGYDVSPEGAMARIQWPYSLVVNLGIKYCYAFKHREQLRMKSQSNADLIRYMLSPGHGLKETYTAARGLSGLSGSSAWLESQQPCLDAIVIPSLMINSRDDPICIWENVEAFKADITANPNLVLAELQRGAHGCKFGFWGFSSVVDKIVSEFVLASWHEWRRAQGRV